MPAVRTTFRLVYSVEQNQCALSAQGLQSERSLTVPQLVELFGKLLPTHLERLQTALDGDPDAEEVLARIVKGAWHTHRLEGTAAAVKAISRDVAFHLRRVRANHKQVGKEKERA